MLDECYDFCDDKACLSRCQRGFLLNPSCGMLFARLLVLMRDLHVDSDTGSLKCDRSECTDVA